MTASAPALPPLLASGAGTPHQAAFFEVLGTARAIRYLRPDPVSRQHIEALAWAGSRASSADNSQPWQFIAVTSPAQRRLIAEAVAPLREITARLPAPDSETAARTRRGAWHLLDHLAEAPLLLFICGANDYPPGQPQERYLWSAVFAAAQNVVVAARSLGLGAVFSMMHVAAPGQVREILGVPPGIRIAVLLAIGWPRRPFGPVTRKPVSEVLRYDHW